MQIAVASGKGGTGKTTVATNLAAVLAEAGQEVTYADCDVEEPDGHLFLRPEIEGTISVGVPVPVVDERLCTLCGKCAEVCAYGALVCLGRVVTFPDLCHGCGGCALVCPSGAIRETRREVGVVEEGRADGIRFIQGRLNVGRPISPPLIRAVKRRLPAQGVQIVDSPPGTACPAIHSVRGANYVLLVAEPTPFGLNDLQLTVEMLRDLGLPFGAVINRADTGDDGVCGYCHREGIDILLEIPDDRRVAEAYSRGQLASAVLPAYRGHFLGLFNRVKERVSA